MSVTSSGLHVRRGLPLVMTIVNQKREEIAKLNMKDADCFILFLILNLLTKII